MASSTPKTFSLLTLTKPQPHIAHILLNRPTKLNAFSYNMWIEFGDAFREASRDPDVRVVVLSAAGDRAFTAGLDVKDAAGDGVLSGSQEDGARFAWKLRERIELYQACVSAMEECVKPVICAIHGLCLGLGIDIASCADIRIAASSSTFSVKEVEIGMAADVGTLARLPKVVGNHSWVKDVCLTARDFSVSEAQSVGLVSRVVEGNREEVLKEAMDLAAVLAEKSPVAVQGTKELLNYGTEHTVKEALRYTAVWNSAALQGDDFRNALGARMMKKKPTFAKL
ncbi:enoyl-CoA hydratase/isomerase [Sarocladium strictum]